MAQSFPQIKIILDDFLSSYDFGDDMINQTFKTTTDQVIPEVLISLFIASHLEGSGQKLQDIIFDKGLKKFLHGLLLAVVGLHNLESIVEFEKRVTNPTILGKSVAFCTGGMCLAKASLILKNEDELVVNEIYKIISTSALAELKRRQAIGRLDFSKDEYILLCKELSSPLKLFVVGPMIRHTNSSQLNLFLKFVECFDLPNRLIKELNICFNLLGNLIDELNAEQPPLLLQLGAKHEIIGKKINQLFNKQISETIMVEMKTSLLKFGLVEEILELIESYITDGRNILQNIKNDYSRNILQTLLDKQETSLKYYSGLYKI